MKISAVTELFPLTFHVCFFLQQLKGGVPLYFSAILKNSEGSRSIATCYIPTYDITLPIGRVDRESKFTSNTRIVRGSAVVHDDSEIVQQLEGVGFGVGQWSDQIVPWTDAMLNERVIDATTSKFSLGETK